MARGRVLGLEAIGQRKRVLMPIVASDQLYAVLPWLFRNSASVSDLRTLAIGPLAGTGLLVEHFTGGASTRTSLAPLAGVTAAALHDLVDRLYLTAVTTFFRAEQMSDASLHAAFAGRASVLVGARW